MKSGKKVIALIIAVLICCSCFFCAEKAEAGVDPPFWYELTFYSCAYVEIIGVSSETLILFEHEYTQIKVNVLQTYLNDFAGDLYVPSECVDFVLSNNYALVFADESDERLICNDYDYDADSSRIIPLFPVLDNKIIIPENYYEVVTYSDNSTGIKTCCRVLSYLEDYNQSLSEDEKYLAFSDGMDIELSNDYFDLMIESKKQASEFYLYLFITRILYLFTGFGTPISFGAILIVVVLIIFYYAEKKKKSKQVDTPSETGKNSKE